MHVPPWIKRLHNFLDNASSTNKNAYMIAWGLEMVQYKKFDFVRISFMIAGHTKFAPDLLFSKVSKSYSVSDIFTTSELCDIPESFASVVVDDGHTVRKWRDALSKYTKLPGVRSLHDFVCVRKPSTGNAHVRVRDVCYEGAIRDSSIKVARGCRPTENVIPGEEYLHDCFRCQSTYYFYEVTLSPQCLYHLLHISVCSACTRVVYTGPFTSLITLTWW
jgi:hypothetical protein